jgi:small-conductance mechanosensitive channel
MQWRQWLAEMGLPVPDSPNVEAMVIAVMLVAGAYGIGWFVGARVGVRIAALLHKWTGRTDGVTAKVAAAILCYGLAALLLVVVGRSAATTPMALVVVAVALGFGVGMLVYRLLRVAHVRAGLGSLLAVFALVAAAAGMLGGMQPLTTALAEVGFGIGSRRFSLLAVVNFLIVAGVLLLVARIVSRLLDHSIGRISAFDATQKVLLQKLAGIAVVAVVVLVGVDLPGIDLTAFAVFSGALGLAVGFGLQKTLGNLIAGLILLMDRSVKPGDVIVVSDTFGTVSKIGVRAVSVITRDGKEHLIPNEQLMTEPVENWSYSNRNVRLHIPVGVSYTADLALAQKLMVEAATASPRVLSKPAPSIWLRGFGDSSVDHEILAWIPDPEMGVGAVQSDVLNRVWRLFKENGIEIPFPQRDLHIKSLPGPLLAQEPAPAGDEGQARDPDNG